MDDFETKSDAFLRWFKSQDGASFNSNLSLVDLRARGAGRGIIATADIPADTELFTIPRSAILHVNNPEINDQIANALKDDENDADVENGTHQDDELPISWLSLINTMIFEYLKGVKSKWKPYFDVLPEASQFNTLMFWSNSDLEQLQASAIRSKIGKEQADDMFRRKILPVVRESESMYTGESNGTYTDDQLQALAHRMGSIIMAYAFDLNENDEQEDENDDHNDGWIEERENLKWMGMVPMADMLNADAEFNAYLNHGEDELTMTSIRPIKAGEEVLNYYGPLSNSELLRRYGYTSDKHARYDVVELSWPLIELTLKAYWSINSLEGLIDENEKEESFILEREAGDPDETGINTSQAIFESFPDELQIQINSVNAAMLKIDLSKGKLSSEEKRKLKAAFAEVMLKVIAARLKEYQTTIAEDTEILKHNTLTPRMKMAVEVRVGEKRLLSEAKAFFSQILEKESMKQNNGTAQERPSKMLKSSR